MEETGMTDDAMTPDVREEHRWLARLAGEWTFEGRMIPDEPQYRATGTETVRMLGEAWMLAEANGTMASGCETGSLMTIGFDPETGRFNGTFVASTMTSLWLYDGALDEGGKSLRLQSEGPRFDGQPGKALYEDEIEIVSEDERRLNARIRGDDGAWTLFMTTTYRRNRRGETR